MQHFQRIVRLVPNLRIGSEAKVKLIILLVPLFNLHKPTCCKYIYMILIRISKKTMTGFFRHRSTTLKGTSVTFNVTKHYVDDIGNWSSKLRRFFISGQCRSLNCIVHLGLSVLLFKKYLLPQQYKFTRSICLYPSYFRGRSSLRASLIYLYYGTC